MSTRTKILTTAANLFDAGGFDQTTIADICAAAQVSNGSFFHAYRSKDALGAALYLQALEHYHDHMLAAVAGDPDAATGLARLIQAHVQWVETRAREARFLFEQSRADWLTHVRDAQAAENARFADAMDRWLTPLIAAGAVIDLPRPLFFAQLIGPAQLICRAWLSGRAAKPPAHEVEALVAAAQRALLAR